MEDGNLTGREAEVFTAPGEEDEGEMLSAITAQYYLPRSLLPHEILLPVGGETEEELSQALSQRAGRKVWVHVPQRGEKAELLEMARRNAAEEAERATTKAERSSQTIQILAKQLNLSKEPGRMESYDISNTGSSEIVASMVVYAGDKPQRSAYRRFRIKDVTGHPDDYASMREVLRRRLQRAKDGDEGFLPLPDVFLIDGGRTHADAAWEIVQSFGQNIPVFGMVKDNRHRTRALVTPDGQEIGIQANQAVFSLIGRIQEETHRFAITFNRESHRKNAFRSPLDEIPGIGPKRKETLKKQFGSVKAIQAAGLEDLCAVIGRAAGETLYQALHPAPSEKQAETGD
jgi:excinuclease ABC subunit C